MSAAWIAKPVDLYALNGADLRVRAMLYDPQSIVFYNDRTALRQPLRSALLVAEFGELVKTTVTGPLRAEDMCFSVDRGGGVKRRLFERGRWFCDAETTEARALPLLQTLHEVGHLFLRLGRQRFPVEAVRVRLSDPTGESFSIVNVVTKEIATQPIARSHLTEEARALLSRVGLIGPPSCMEIASTSLLGDSTHMWFDGHFLKADEESIAHPPFLSMRSATPASMLRRKSSFPACAEGSLQKEFKEFLEKEFASQASPFKWYFKLSRETIMLYNIPNFIDNPEPLWRFCSLGEDPNSRKHPAFYCLADALRSFDPVPTMNREYTLILFTAARSGRNLGKRSRDAASTCVSLDKCDVHVRSVQFVSVQPL